MDAATRVQIQDEGDCISHSTNTVGKVWIQLLSLQLRENRRADWLFKLGMAIYMNKLNGSKYSYVSLTIQLNISHLFTHS